MTTVLVVDDNEMLRTSMARRLRRRGYAVLLAANGLECLAVARAEHPGAILLDLTMPVMDGWTAARELRADPATSGIPILACTGHALTADIDRALAAGCDDYVIKPFDFNVLLSKVEALRARRGTGSFPPGH